MLFRLSSGTSSRAWDDGVSIKSAVINETEDDEANLIQLIEPETGCWHTFARCVGGMLYTFYRAFVVTLTQNHQIIHLFNI